MKKLLALVLALVMTLGLATVGSNAAFKDDADIDYMEAVDVMSTIGVLAGMEDGNFQPKGNLTREQGAKIITYMLLGPTAADALTAPKAPFSDVAADRWSAGSIAYCVSEGIINGVGDNKFDPTGALTGYAFAKMALVALGYRADMEGLTGDDWALNTASLVRKVGLSDGISAFAGNATLNRETAAQMGLNTLKATEVYYDTTSSVSSDGTSSVGTKTRASSVANTTSDYNFPGDSVMQLCEDVFPNLKLNVVTDAFGRPANQWTYNGKLSDKFVSTAVDYTYTAAVKNKDLRSTLGTNITDNYTWSATFNQATVATTGVSDPDLQVAYAADVLAGTNTDYTATAKGVKTEIYVNNDNQTVKVVMTRPVIAKITAISSTQVSFSYGDNLGSSGSITKSADANLYAELAAMKKGDYFAAVMNGGTLVDIQSVNKVTGVITSYNSSSNVYVVGGTSYTKAAYYTTGFPTAGSVDWDLWLSEDNFVLYGKAVSADEGNYLYIVDDGISRDGTALAGYTYSAKVLFPDGTLKWITLGNTDDVTTYTTPKSFYDNINSVDQTFYMYDAQSDGTYKLSNKATGLTETTITGTPNIAKGTANAIMSKSVNNATVYLRYDATNDKVTYYVGYRNVASMNTIAGEVLANANSTAKCVVITSAAAAASSDFVYILDNTKYEASMNGSTAVRTYTAVVNGELKDDLQAAASMATALGTNQGKIITPTYNSKGYISSATYSGATQANAANGSTTGAFNNSGSKGVALFTAEGGTFDITLEDGSLKFARGTTNVSIIVTNDFVANYVDNTGDKTLETLTLDGTANQMFDESADYVLVYFNDNGEATYMLAVNIA